MYFGTTTTNLSNDLFYPVLNYATKFKNKDLTLPENLKKMDNWIKKNYAGFDKYKEILSCGYCIKYDKRSNFYLFVIFGEDKKISDKNLSIVDLDNNEVFSIKSPNFIEYLFNGKDYDIVLFGYNKPWQLGFFGAHAIESFQNDLTAFTSSFLKGVSSQDVINNFVKTMKK